MADESEQTRMAGCLFFFFFWTHNGLKSNAFHRLDNLVIKCKKLRQTCFLFFFVFGFVPLQKLQKHFHCTLHEILSTKLNQDKARMSLPQGSGFKEGSGGFKTKGARGFKLGFFGSSCVSNWGFKGYGSKLGLKTIFGFQILVWVSFRFGIQDKFLELWKLILKHGLGFQSKVSGQSWGFMRSMPGRGASMSDLKLGFSSQN